MAVLADASNCTTQGATHDTFEGTKLAEISALLEGVALLVGVADGVRVAVGVAVGVENGTTVDAGVGVRVGVLVGVADGVADGVAVGAIEDTELLDDTEDCTEEEELLDDELPAKNVTF